MGLYLSKPDKNKTSSSGENAQLRFGVSAMQGWRTSMEDAHMAFPDLSAGISLFGVFDGHGGAEVSRFCSKHFGEELKKNQNFLDGRFSSALEETFLKMDELLLMPENQAELKQLKNQGSDSNSAGCTANVVLITKTELICANAGDSRSYLYDCEGKTIALSSDHKPELDEEKKRIKAAGGYVSEGRVNDNLNLSRAIGDFEFKKNKKLKPTEQIISAFPDIKTVKLERKPRFLIIGCDGIWETLSPEKICETSYVKMRSAPNVKLTSILEGLLDNLVGKDTVDGVGCDNMSAILVEFK